MKRTILVLLLLFIVACTGGGSSGGGSKGSGKLEFTWERAPPSTVVGDELVFEIKYDNQGQHDIQNMDLYLHGYSTSIFPNLRSHIRVGSVPGMSTFISQSIPQYQQWTTSINHPTASYDQILSVTACYDYQTQVAPSLCIYNPASGVDIDGACSPGISMKGDKQGPLEVSGVRADFTSDKVYLEIDINNAGSGTVYSGNPASCYKLGIQERNEFRMDVRLADGSRFTCPLFDRYQYARLDDSGRTTITCWLTYNTDNYVSTPALITLYYNYAETLSKKITIEPIGYDP